MGKAVFIILRGKCVHMRTGLKLRDLSRGRCAGHRYHVAPQPLGNEISEYMKFLPQACSFCHRSWKMRSLAHGLCSLAYTEGQNQVPSSLGLL